MWSAGGISILALGSICILSILTHDIAAVTCFIYTLDHKEQSYVFSLCSWIAYPGQFSPRSFLNVIVSEFHYTIDNFSFCSVIHVFKQQEMAKGKQGQQDFVKGATLEGTTWNRSFLIIADYLWII